MKKMLGNIYFIGLFLSVLFCNVFFCNHTARAESRGGYVINSYDCYYRVTEDHVYHVIETIDVYFTEPRHGIYRLIPEVNQIVRKDGTTDTVIAQINVTSVSDEYTDERNGSDREIKIGDPDKEITGHRVYTLAYDVMWGDDRLEGADEFYMNLIGNGWDVPIPNLTFAIEMPEPFDTDPENIGMYYGAYGEADVKGIRYGINENTIFGKLEDVVLQPGESFTVRIELEDGYFTDSGSINRNGIIALVLCCAFLAVSLVIWFIKGRDEDVTDMVEFYPPDGLNCAEMAYAYYGRLNNKDVVPMLIGLADKGYIEIIQKDDKGNEFSFRVLKEYTGTDKAEELYLKGLEKYGAVVTKKELENSFYKTLDKVRKSVEESLRKKIFYESTLWWRLIAFPFAFIPYLVGLYPILRIYEGEFYFPMIEIGSLFGIVTIFSLTIISKKSPVVWRIVAFVLMAGALFLWYELFHYEVDFIGPFYFMVGLGCMAANVMQMVFYRIIDKRTDYGIDLLGRIRGFKRYLETAQRPHLVSLVNQDPKYFYKILPYTYVLGITDVWVEQFESIAMEPPKWYRGSYGRVFNYHTFNSFMDKTMSSAQSAMTSSPKSSSGGGFSGGGGGGGGGGSW